MSDLIKLQNVYDYERVSKEKLSSNSYDYYASGACDEITLKKNVKSFQQIDLWPRVLTDISQPNLSTTILGRTINVPLLPAPMAVMKLAHPDSEIGVARAVKEIGSIMVLSCVSSTLMEDVANEMDSYLPDAAGGRWLQLYILNDREVTKNLVKRAEAAGYSALCVTVDTPIAGKREANIRNRFIYPEGIRPENFVSLFEEAKKKTYISDMNQFIIKLFKFVTWEDIVWLKGITSLPIILKGILSPLDAQLAVKYGVSAIVVSNHGGRQLDTSPATIKALPLIAEAIKGSGVEIILDGGIRRGSDIFKAIALGATCVMVGRPILWGLATSGQRGATEVLKMLVEELKNTMQLCGCDSVKGITKQFLEHQLPSKM